MLGVIYGMNDEENTDDKENLLKDYLKNINKSLFLKFKIVE